MATVNIKINGQQIQARAGVTLLEAAKEAGIDIPTLCHHPALANIGACRVCLVEVAKQRTLQPACTFPISEGMEVETESPKAVEARKFVLEMLFSERNHYCMYCEMSGDCELQALAYRYGLDHWTYPSPHAKMTVDGTRKYFIMDHNRCILCRRCIRACSDLVANHTLGVRFRGAKTMISADMDVPFGDSTCVSCGTCLQVCPTGALVDRKSAYMGREVHVERTASACTFCAVGCGTSIVTRAGHVLRVEGDWDAPNQGVLCVAGRFEPLYDRRERITSPMLRKGNGLVPVSWDEALGAIAAKAKGNSGKKAAAYVTGKALNDTLGEFLRVFQGKMQATVGTVEPTLADLDLPVGGSLADVDAADCILVAGGDPLATHRVLGYRVKRALDKGARLLVVTDKPNGMLPFAHRKFGMAQLDEAVKVCQGSAAPVVIYGGDLDKASARKLAALAGKARFISLFPASNGYRARELGLTNGFSANGVKVLYLLLGDEELPDEAVKEARRAPFLVVHAAYKSAATDVADVVLPAPLWYEQEGSFTALDGRKVVVKPAVAAPEGVLAEAAVLARLAESL
ncbi:MAG: 2Fe-2S iron-sulfur cluster-binding protein [Anaerolineae bacterium]|jgi:formate dehydrogenase major subunit|nr:2Fe-2S iron-sulfur cluster-binding protein [Anaerolineae bacterium]